MKHRNISLFVKVIFCLTICLESAASDKIESNRAVGETYETQAKGIRILPGQWRPHYPWEQIVWVSPSWPSQDYIWLDFPEAIFSDQGLLFLSHINPAHPVVFPNLPRVQWQAIAGGIAFERVLPNGVKFGGSVVTNCDSTGVSLELYIDNGSEKPLRNIKLQTCAYLRAIREFSDFTVKSKFVHLPEAGWQPFEAARACGLEMGRFRLGWRGGPAAADLPVMVTTSNQGKRLVAMTWYDDTYSLISNPEHPCMHADPFFPDLEAGQRAKIRGEILFFEGTVDQFSNWFEKRYKKGQHTAVPH